MVKLWRSGEPVFAVVNDHDYVCLNAYGPQPIHIALWTSRADAERFAEGMTITNTDPKVTYRVVEVRLAEVVGD